MLTHQLAKVLAGLVLGDAVNGVWIGHVHEATKREALKDHEDHVLMGVVDHLEQPNYMGAATWTDREGEGEGEERAQTKPRERVRCAKDERRRLKVAVAVPTASTLSCAACFEYIALQG